MFSFTIKCILSLILVLGICIDVILSSPLRSYQEVPDQIEREMLTLAKIMRIAMALPDSSLMLDKRNAGTVDTLYNLPDLFNEGR